MVDVVVTVSVAETGAVPVTLTDDVTAQVAGLVAPMGMVVTEHESVITPVKPLDGAAEIEVVLPVVAAAATEMLPPFERVKLAAAVTVTETAVDVLLLKFESPA